MKLSGSVTFSDAATDLLVHVSGRLGIYGDEAVEDFYMLVASVGSLLVAIVAVLTIERVFTTRRRES